MKWISPSQTPSSPQASAASVSSTASRKAAASLLPRRRSSTKIPKCMTVRTMPYSGRRCQSGGRRRRARRFSCAARSGLQLAPRRLGAPWSGRFNDEHRLRTPPSRRQGAALRPGVGVDSSWYGSPSSAGAEERRATSSGCRRLRCWAGLRPCRIRCPESWFATWGRSWTIPSPRNSLRRVPRRARERRPSSP